jgi:hypothetical protein
LKPVPAVAQGKGLAAVERETAKVEAGVGDAAIVTLLEC